MEEDGKTVKLYAQSDWCDTMAEAEDECDDRIEDLEDRTVSDMESEGWEYTSGETSGYDREFDRTNSRYRCGAERVLEFVRADANFLELEAAPVTLKSALADPPPTDVEEQLLALVRSKIPASQSFRQCIPRIDWKTGTEDSADGVQEEKGMICFKVKRALQSITFKSLKVVDSNLQLSADVQVINVPRTEAILRVPYDNCGSPEQTLVREFVANVKRGWKFETKSTLTKTTKIEGELKFGESGSAGVSHEIKREMSTSRSYEETTETTEKRTFTVKIASNSKVDVEFRSRSLEARRSFGGPITVEGVLVAQYEGRIVKQYQLVDLLDASSRTLEISGYYSNIDYEESPMTVRATPC